MFTLKPGITTLLILVCATSHVAQIQLDGNREIHDQERIHGGLPMGVVDINNDLLDDIVLLKEGTELVIGYQDWRTSTFHLEELGSCGEDEQWSLVVADLDKNGWKDIVVAGAYDAIRIFYQDEGNFRKETLPAPELYAQAMNAVDINSDGWLDLFICSDRGYNEVWWNREGELLEKDGSNLFRDLTIEETQGNYGSEWVDVDGDGDLDLYIAKCHPRAVEPDDLRRVNRLYINNGNNNWKEQAVLRGVASGAQSWTGHFGDTDNDGDFDLLVTNHDRKAQLYLNDDGGLFRDWTSLSGLEIGGPVIQSLMDDFDGDGFLDIAIGGIPDYLYSNTGFNHFVPSDKDFGLYDVTTMAKGDLNNDGRIDIYGAYLELLNKPSALPNEAFFNQTTANWLNIYLQGKTGSSESVGAEVRVYSSLGIQTRMVRAGESYGVQNSYKVCIGLNEVEMIDSIIVNWPSGVVQRHGPADAHGWLVFYEAGHIIKETTSYRSEPDTICQGDSLWIEAPLVGMTYKWNDNNAFRGRWVKDEGFYQVQVTLGDSNIITLPGVVVIKDPVEARGLRFLQGDSIMCSGDLAILGHAEGKSIRWMDQSIDENLLIQEPGNYWGHVTGYCRELATDTVRVSYLDEAVMEWVKHDTVPRGRQARLVVSDTMALWYSSRSQDTLLHTGDTLVIDSLLASTTFYAFPVSRYESVPYQIGKSSVTADIIVRKGSYNGTMIFDVLQPCRLLSFSVYSDYPGERRFMLYDDSAFLLDSFDIYIDTGWHSIPVDFLLSPEVGRYRLTTDGEHNLSQWGLRSPLLGSTFQDVSYPYTTDKELFRIVRSQSSTGIYDYFFDWKIAEDAKICPGEPEAVHAVIDSAVSTDLVGSPHPVLIYPNPAHGRITVESAFRFQTIQGFNLSGQAVPLKVRHDKVGGCHKYDIDFPPGGLIVLRLDELVKLIGEGN